MSSGQEVPFVAEYILAIEDLLLKAKQAYVQQRFDDAVASIRCLALTGVKCSEAYDAIQAANENSEPVPW